jgi:hypothetical protein
VDGDVGHAELKRLKIGVDRHELDPGNPGLDHAVDGIDATPADTHDPDDRLMRLATAGRLILRLLPPIPRSFHNRLNLTSLARLLGEHTLQPLRRGLFRATLARS